ncbi:MAG: PEP-CTERM sorting domain-containing protein [Planctomycetota bacterium]
MKSVATLTVGVIAGLSFGASAQAQIISDDFEVDSSASYTLVDESNAASGDGTPDSTSTFAFDYIAAGIPLAPNSSVGDVGGLRLAANETSADAGAADHITAFHNTAITAPEYRLTVDVYMQVESAGGSTEFGHVGVGSSSSDYLSIFTPVVFNGNTLAFTGEGGSASDYRISDNDQIFNTGDPVYLANAVGDSNTTNATGDIYQTIFSDANGYEFAGSPGNNWATLEVAVIAGIVTYSFNGVDIIQTAYDPTGNLIALGYADVFSSVGPHAVIYDNLSVEIIPEPTSLALMGVGSLALLRRRGA